MARSIDLTGKLGLDGNPTIAIGDAVLTVDDSAENMLKVFDFIGDDGMNVQKVIGASELIFTKDSQKALKDLKLSFSDYAVLVEEAIGLVVGGLEGKAQTPGTTS